MLDYRIPDLVFARTALVSEGAAELVVELLSKGDESREKLNFYAEVGVSEVLLIDPATREVELYELRGGKLHLALPDDNGVLRLQTLGVKLGAGSGPVLTLAWPGGTTSI